MLVPNTVDYHLFKRMREWPMANIVQQDGYSYCFFFGLGNYLAFVAQGFNGQAHQVHSTKGMVKTGMQCSGINEVRHAQLLNIAQALKIGMFYQVENQVGRYADEPVNRVVNYLLFIQSSFSVCKNAIQRYNARRTIVNFC